MVEQHRLVAEPLDRARVVRDEDDRPAAALEVADLAEALLLERLVADGEHLVQQQHVGLDVHRDREAEPHVHPRRVRPHRHVGERLQLGEGDDLLQVPVDVLALEPVDGRVQVDVLDPGELGVEAGADLDQRADPPADGERAGRGREDPGEQLQQRRLARAVRADDPEGLAGRDVEVDVTQRPELARARQLAPEERRLQRAVLREADREHPPQPAGADLPGRHRGALRHLRARSRCGPRSAASPRARAARRAGRRGRCRSAAAPPARSPAARPRARPRRTA